MVRRPLMMGLAVALASPSGGGGVWAQARAARRKGKSARRMGLQLPPKAAGRPRPRVRQVGERRVRAPARVRTSRAVTGLADRGRHLLTEGRLGGSVLLFGAPMALGMALYTAFNFVDLWMVAQLEGASVALAALGVCDNVAAVAQGLFLAAIALLQSLFPSPVESGTFRVNGCARSSVG